MADLLNKVKIFVNDSFKGKNILHFERTLYWINYFRPNADKALQIAAYAHDIERAYRTAEIAAIHKKSEKGFQDDEFLKHHQERGAEIIGEFLIKEGASKELIERVKMLVLKHEHGGNEDQDLLKDCDTLSFFETNADMFIKEKAKILGKKKVKSKFDWMFNRLSSNKVKEVARPLYLNALEDLEKQAE